MPDDFKSQLRKSAINVIHWVRRWALTQQQKGEGPFLAVLTLREKVEGSVVPAGLFPYPGFSPGISEAQQNCLLK